VKLVCRGDDLFVVLELVAVGQLAAGFRGQLDTSEGGIQPSVFGCIILSYVSFKVINEEPTVVYKHF
jgi:hypothetical protein